jgi:hypothetical protein
MGATGLEAPPFYAGTARVPESGGNKSGNKAAVSGSLTPADHDLAAVVAAWPNLPATIRAGMKAMVQAATGRGGGK